MSWSFRPCHIIFISMNGVEGGEGEGGVKRFKWLVNQLSTFLSKTYKYVVIAGSEMCGMHEYP